MTELSIKEIANFILGNAGRIFGSKSIYSYENSNSLVVYNGNIVTAEEGKIWFGDIDITKDFDLLISLSKKINRTIYVLPEISARFENEKDPILEDFYYMIKNIDGIISIELSKSLQKYYKLEGNKPIKINTKSLSDGKIIYNRIKIEDFDIFMSNSKKESECPLNKFYTFLSKKLNINIRDIDVNSIYIDRDDFYHLKFLVLRWIKNKYKMHIIKVKQELNFMMFNFGPNILEEKDENILDSGYIYITKDYK